MAVKDTSGPSVAAPGWSATTSTSDRRSGLGSTANLARRCLCLSVVPEIFYCGPEVLLRANGITLTVSLPC